MKDLELLFDKVFMKDCETLLEISPIFIKHMYSAIDEAGYGVALNDNEKIVLFKKDGEERVEFNTFIEMFPVLFDDQIKSAIEQSLEIQGKEPIKFERLSTKKVKEAKTIIRASTTKEDFEELEEFVEKINDKSKMC
ncbi:hypothetical protein [Cetobacterium sp.]|uniref:hypothetical protein n=1 Tax=Cetobacterium sp. TaxID=2071632 RepID=UPI003F2EE28C